MRKLWAKAWRERCQVTRTDIFGEDDPLCPTSTSDQVMRDVLTPVAGMVGTDYRPGGTLILSVNPAGGKDTYAGSAADTALYDAFRALAVADGEERISSCFEVACAEFCAQLPGWSVYTRHLQYILRALGLRLSEIAYPYLVPFRTKGDAGSTMPKRFIDTAYSSGGGEACLLTLQPGRIVAIDRPSGDCMLRFKAATGAPIETWYYTRQQNAHAARAETLRAMAQQAR